MIIQSASAVYILVLIGIGVSAWLRYVLFGTPIPEGGIHGIPALLLVIATVICAITTLGAV